MDLPSLKSRLPLTSVLPRYSLEPDRNGMLCCPFHEDRKLSMQVSGESLYCHSTNCAQHGRHIGVIDLVKLKEGLTKHEAILRCKAMAGEPATALKAGIVSNFADGIKFRGYGLEELLIAPGSVFRVNSVVPEGDKHLISLAQK